VHDNLTWSEPELLDAHPGFVAGLAIRARTRQARRGHGLVVLQREAPLKKGRRTGQFVRMFPNGEWDLVAGQWTGVSDLFELAAELADVEG
jgi:hypothetical protein